MKINVNQNLKSPKGDELTYADSKEIITLKDVISDVLLTPTEKEEGKEKYIKYELCKKILETKDIIELKTDEISDIKKLIGKIKPAWIVGQTWDMLEGGEK